MGKVSTPVAAGIIFLALIIAGFAVWKFAIEPQDHRVRLSAKERQDVQQANIKKMEDGLKAKKSDKTKSAPAAHNG